MAARRCIYLLSTAFVNSKRTKLFFLVMNVGMYHKRHLALMRFLFFESVGNNFPFHSHVACAMGIYFLFISLYCDAALAALSATMRM